MLFLQNVNAPLFFENTPTLTIFVLGRMKKNNGESKHSMNENNVEHVTAYLQFQHQNLMNLFELSIFNLKRLKNIILTDHTKNKAAGQDHMAENQHITHKHEIQHQHQQYLVHRQLKQFITH